LKKRTKLLSANGIIKHVGSRIVVCDLSQFKPRVKKGGIHCKRLHPFEKHEGVGPKGSKFCFATNQQTPKKGVSKNGLIQKKITFLCTVVVC
jgi:hypothetical protein